MDVYEVRRDNHGNEVRKRVSVKKVSVDDEIRAAKKRLSLQPAVRPTVRARLMQLLRRFQRRAPPAPFDD
jgi:hypothetical protein